MCQIHSLTEGMYVILGGGDEAVQGSPRNLLIGIQISHPILHINNNLGLLRRRSPNRRLNIIQPLTQLIIFNLHFRPLPPLIPHLIQYLITSGVHGILAAGFEDEDVEFGVFKGHVVIFAVGYFA